MADMAQVTGALWSAVGLGLAGLPKAGMGVSAFNGWRLGVPILPLAWIVLLAL